MYTHTYFFFFNDTATTEIYTLSLHDALPISLHLLWGIPLFLVVNTGAAVAIVVAFVVSYAVLQNMLAGVQGAWFSERSEEHTSELQSRQYLVCRLLLEKKKSTATSIVRSRVY